MITAQEQEKIQQLSDIELYPQAVELIRGIGKTLPPTQINGLLNVSLANTYARLKEFTESQQARTTWRRNDEHIPVFYKRLSIKFEQFEQYAQAILKLRAEKPSQEDIQTFYMLITREFIQHLLAENAYIGAKTIMPNTQRANHANQDWQKRND